MLTGGCSPNLPGGSLDRAGHVAASMITRRRLRLNSARAGVGGAGGGWGSPGQAEGGAGGIVEGGWREGTLDDPGVERQGQGWNSTGHSATHPPARRLWSARRNVMPYSIYEWIAGVLYSVNRRIKCRSLFVLSHMESPIPSQINIAGDQHLSSLRLFRSPLPRRGGKGQLEWVLR